MRKAFILIALFIFSGNVFAHAGRTDSSGGHNNRSTGQYHCHKEPCLSNQGQFNEAVKEAVKQKRAFSGLYNRSDWPHWIDADKDCQDTRAEALINASRTPVKFKRQKGCTVSHGTWFDPYTNLTFTQAGKLDIDHIIPLKEAHVSGGESWTRSERRTFANDHENLIVVSAGENRGRGAKDPTRWLPDTLGFRCEYIERWVFIKNKYGLSSDQQEKAAINSVLAGCQ